MHFAWNQLFNYKFDERKILKITFLLILQFWKFWYFVYKVFTEIKLNMVLFAKIKQNKVKRDFIWK
jgi:hypothetical protein